jgi:hypothetical protein
MAPVAAFAAGFFVPVSVFAVPNFVVKDDDGKEAQLEAGHSTRA